MTDGVAKFLKTMAIIVILAGIIGGIFIANQPVIKDGKITTEFSFIIYLGINIGTVMFGSILIGFAKIVDATESIRRKIDLSNKTLKNILKYTEDKNS